MSFLMLKIIALLSMLWDHVTATWPPGLWIWLLFFPDAAELPDLAVAISRTTAFLGRIAAPIFLFCISNGFLHTKDRKRYALRLLVFAVLSQFPYYLANRAWAGGALSFWEAELNIIFTQLLGLIALTLWEKGLEKHWALGALGAAAVCLLAELVPVEGGGRYILFILVFYLTRDWAVWKRAVLWLVLLPLARYSWTWEIIADAVNGALDGRWFYLYILNVFGPYLGVLFTFAYNGKKGADHPAWKYLWYCFYPAHLLVLGLVGSGV